MEPEMEVRGEQLEKLLSSYKGYEDMLRHERQLLADAFRLGFVVNLICGEVWVYDYHQAGRLVGKHTPDRMSIARALDTANDDGKMSYGRIA